MTTDTKNLCDVILGVLTLAGAGVAFVLGLLQWRRGQAWQRADKLDKCIEKFETDPLLRLAATILDWTERDDTKVDGKKIKIGNDDVLLALRDHRTMDQASIFPGEQPRFRDAYDVLLSFLNRLELSISTGLIDSGPTRSYFIYWLERLLTFDRHEDNRNVLRGLTPPLAVVGYIKAYGDPKSVVRLCEYFGYQAPSALAECCAERDLAGFETRRAGEGA